MRIDSLGTERLKMLYNSGLVRNIADLYDLRKDQLIGLASDDQSATIQAKGADNILAAIEQSKQVPFERVLFALGIRFVGEVGAKKLARYFSDIDSLMNASQEELAQVEDIGEKTATQIYNYFQTPEHRQIVERLRTAGLQMKSAVSKVSNALEGKTFVVSGVFSRFSRDEIKNHIEQHGGKVSSSLSAKTSYLLAGERMGPEKLKKAEKLSIPVISEEDYLKMIEE
jgi:DNA ligase (NAD+)